MLRLSSLGKAELQSGNETQSCFSAIASNEIFPIGAGKADSSLPASQSSAVRERGEEGGRVPWREFLCAAITEHAAGSKRAYV
jgi:hypothetical protein